MSEASTKSLALKPDQNETMAGTATPHDRVDVQHKEHDNGKRTAVDDGAGDHDQSQDDNLKRRHSEAFTENDIGSASHPDNSASGRRLIKPNQPSPQGDGGSAVVDGYDSKDKLEIVAQNEAFVEKDDDWVFDHTKIILQKGKDYFSTVAHRTEPELDGLDLASLDLTPIPRGDFCPLLKEGITQAPEASSLGDTYLKRPSLITWDPTDDNPTRLAELVLQEAEICETLKKHPHPNIVRYFGCSVEDGRIVGLVLAKYTSQLSDKIADSGLAERQAYYEGVEKGVKHLHQIGLVHNDLNPSNIMLDGTIPVIIDFDSCRPKGEKMGEKGGTFGWELEEAEYSVPENDLHGLERLREYILKGGEVDFD